MSRTELALALKELHANLKTLRKRLDQAEVGTDTVVAVDAVKQEADALTRDCRHKAWQR